MFALVFISIYIFFSVGIFNYLKTIIPVPFFLDFLFLYLCFPEELQLVAEAVEAKVTGLGEDSFGSEIGRNMDGFIS